MVQPPTIQKDAALAPMVLAMELNHNYIIELLGVYKDGRITWDEFQVALQLQVALQPAVEEEPMTEGTKAEEAKVEEPKTEEARMEETAAQAESGFTRHDVVIESTSKTAFLVFKNKKKGQPGKELDDGQLPHGFGHVPQVGQYFS